MTLNVWLALLTIILPCVALAENSIPALPLPDGAAMIFNIGSPDAAGYRIVVLPSGKAISVDGAGRGQGQLPADMANRFFLDLGAAMPLSQLPAVTCTKTAIAPLPTFVTFHGERSADLSCGGGDKSAALLGDALAIARTLYVSNFRAKAMRIFFTPGAQPAEIPSATPPPSYPSGGYGSMGGY